MAGDESVAEELKKLMTPKPMSSTARFCARLCLVGLLVMSAAVAVHSDDWSYVSTDLLTTFAQSEDASVRAHAIAALGKQGGPTAESILQKALDDRVWAIRWKAAEGLGKMGRIDAIDPLLRRLKTEVELEKTQQAAQEAPRYHGYVPVPEFLQRQIAIAMREIIKRDERAGAKEVVERLVGVMLDPSEQGRTRSQVALILGELGDKRSVPVLIHALADEPSGALRAFSAKTLGKLGAEEAIPALTAALEDPYETRMKRIRIVHNAAVRALEKLTSPQSSTAPESGTTGDQVAQDGDS